MGLLVAEDDTGGVVLDLAEGDEAAALEALLGERRTGGRGEFLGVAVNGRRGIGAQDTFVAPLLEIGSGAGIDVLLIVVGGFGATENYAHQVVRTGVVIARLHFGGDFVVGLG